jgi:hypothetical protein
MRLWTPDFSSSARLSKTRDEGPLSVRKAFLLRRVAREPITARRSFWAGNAFCLGALLVVCPSVAAGSPTSEPEQPSKAHPIALLGPNNPGRVSMDYLGYDEVTDSVWVPGGNTGKVFVIDARTEHLRSVDGFPVRDADGRVLGPSSVSFGPHVAFVGNRADSTVCAVNTSTLKRGGCITLASTPDGLAYAANTREVWATTPRTHSIALLGVTESGLKEAGRIELDGQPEGYAVDTKRARFFTNLEDKDETLAIDLATHAVKARWKTGCGAKGPRGMAIDVERGLLFVACTSGLVAFSLDREDAQVGAGATGEGVDNPSIAVGLKRVFAAAGTAGALSIFEYGQDGGLSPLRNWKTASGVRVVVADKLGKAFAADSAGGRIWVLGP